MRKWSLYLVKNWEWSVMLLANCFLTTNHWSYGIAIYVVLLVRLCGRDIWRAFIFSPPIWAIRWHLRPLWRRLHWIFGRKWYWVHQRGIAKVVVTERDPEHNMWSFMEYRQWEDGKKRLNRFSSGTSCVFYSIEDAIKYLVHIHSDRFDSAEEYWKKKGKV
jgi:hypothetical protein